MTPIDLITLLGLGFSLFSLLCTLAANPRLDQASSPSLLGLSGTCILMYQLLDNMDGKQARRTGTSSALGTLFDHGCGEEHLDLP
jgi:ethanolaminephosphotransferase